MSKTHGQFVWYDLMTTDPKAAETFYRDVVGWQATDSGMTDRAYTLLSAGPAMVAGLMPIPADAAAQGVPPCWSGYIATDDVDAEAARVKKAGGAIRREPTDIPGVGRFAVVADPQGAVFLLFKGTSEAPPALPDPKTPGQICWRELHASNSADAFAFYSGLFGWKKTEAFDGPMGTYQTFATDETRCGGVMSMPPGAPGPCWLYYFSVDAIGAATARVRDGGGAVMNGPMQVPDGGWVAQCRDPQGAVFGLASFNS